MLTEVLGPDRLAAVFAHAAAEFPRECCGFVRRSGVRPARNVIDTLRESRPDEFERSAVTGYALGLADALLLDTSFEGDDPVLVLYHSHPNGRAYFSDEDVRRALLDGAPVYPGLLHLVVGVTAGGVREARLFGFADGRFEELARFDPRHADPAAALTTSTTSEATWLR